MGVVHGHHEGLPFVHAFEPARHGLQAGDAARHRLGLNAIREPRAAGRQNVIHVDLPEKRRFHGEPQLSELHVEPQSLKAGCNVARAQIRLGPQAVPEYFRPRVQLDLPRQNVVAIQHRELGRRPAGAGE